MHVHYVLLSRFAGIYLTLTIPNTWYRYGFVILTFSCWFSFPLFGLLADIWIGRYKAILIGIMFYMMDYNGN